MPLRVQLIHLVAGIESIVDVNACPELMKLAILSYTCIIHPLYLQVGHNTAKDYYACWICASILKDTDTLGF